MLRRILRSRTARDIADGLLVLAATSLVLFAFGTLAAHWIVRQWAMSAEIGVSLVAVYLPIAGTITAAIATPHLIRVVRSLRGRG
jgi:hypothetical protein